MLALTLGARRLSVCHLTTSGRVRSRHPIRLGRARASGGAPPTLTTMVNIVGRQTPLDAASEGEFGSTRSRTRATTSSTRGPRPRSSSGRRRRTRPSTRRSATTRSGRSRRRARCTTTSSRTARRRSTRCPARRSASPTTARRSASRGRRAPRRTPSGRSSRATTACSPTRRARARAWRTSRRSCSGCGTSRPSTAARPSGRCAPSSSARWWTRRDGVARGASWLATDWNRAQIVCRLGRDSSAGPSGAGTCTHGGEAVDRRDARHRRPLGGRLCDFESVPEGRRRPSRAAAHGDHVAYAPARAAGSPSFFLHGGGLCVILRASGGRPQPPRRRRRTSRSPVRFRTAFCARRSHDEEGRRATLFEANRARIQPDAICSARP